jgi:hypothetical protein
MAEGSARRDAWKMRTAKSSITNMQAHLGGSRYGTQSCIDCALLLVGCEELFSDHPLYEQLHKYHQQQVLSVDWYASATHQGLQYHDGRGLVWTDEERGTVIGKYLQAVECNQSHYITCHLYRQFSNGAAFKTTKDAILYVKPHMLTGDFTLVPLDNKGNLVPCLFVEEGNRLLIVICDH